MTLITRAKDARTALTSLDYMFQVAEAHQTIDMAAEEHRDVSADKWATAYEAGFGELMHDLPVMLARLTPGARQVLAKLLADLEWIADVADALERLDS
jgi:hypothetical protein